jgi:hypothetical protein
MTDETLATGAAPAENPAPAIVPETKPEPAAQPGADPKPDPKPAPTGKEPGKEDPKPAADAKGPWGDDWREKLANGDEKRLERLKRFADPMALLAAQEEGQKKISEGLKPKARPGDKATDDEWSAYRKEAGIPDKVEDYVAAIKLPDARLIGDDDKPIVEAFSERALKAGIHPGDMGVMVNSYYDLQEDIAYQQSVKDADFRKTAEADLKAAWGGDYQGNIAAMRPYFEAVDAGLMDNLMGGRLADGTKIGNHPGLLKFFATKAVAENPMATVLENNNNGMETLEAEIKKLETRMGADRAAWFKDEAAGKRLQQLYDARDKAKAK